jgi:hypothetical protein
MAMSGRAKGDHLEHGRVAQSWGELDFAGLWRQLTAK